MTQIKTKIIATIGPSTSKYSDLKSLHAAGMNVARINMSHASHSDAINIINSIKKINQQQSKVYGPAGILLDTQGPEIRTGINQSDIDLNIGDIVNLTIRDDVDVETSSIKINYKGLIKSVEKGSKISIDNGLLNFKVLAKDNENLKCRVLDGGTLGSKRHVNLPGVRVDLPSITKKDRKDINLAIKHNVSFIALSFVRSAKDVLDLRAILKKKKSRRIRLSMMPRSCGVLISTSQGVYQLLKKPTHSSTTALRINAASSSTPLLTQRDTKAACLTSGQTCYACRLISINMASDGTSGSTRPLTKTCLMMILSMPCSLPTAWSPTMPQ